MLVTYRSITRREKARRRFRWWYRQASPHARVYHLMNCTGCVGCRAILEEIESYPEETDVTK